MKDIVEAMSGSGDEVIEEVEELIADEEEDEELGVKVQGVVNGSRWKTS